MYCSNNDLVEALNHGISNIIDLQHFRSMVACTIILESVFFLHNCTRELSVISRGGTLKPQKIRYYDKMLSHDGIEIILTWDCSTKLVSADSDQWHTFSGLYRYTVCPL